MNDTNALFAGLDSIVEMRARKKHFEREQTEGELRQRAMKLQEENAGERRRAAAREELERRRQRVDDTLKRADATDREATALQEKIAEEAWARSPQNPVNVARAAQTAHTQAQTTALKAKPATAITAHLQGIEEYTDGMTKALLENQQALQRAQAGDPEGMALATKAQLKLQTLQAYGQQLLKGVRPEKPTSIVKVKRQSEDGGTTEELEVPAEQWNDQHPAWVRFNPPAAGGAALSPEDMKAAAWARANPQDPRSAQILQRLKLK